MLACEESLGASVDAASFRLSRLDDAGHWAALAPREWGAARSTISELHVVAQAAEFAPKGRQKAAPEGEPYTP